MNEITPEMLAQLVEREKAINERASKLLEENPGMPPITAVIIAGDQASAEAWTERVTSGEYKPEAAAWLIGSYSRFGWALDHCGRAWVKKNIAELWTTSDPSDTERRFLDLWKEAKRENGGYVRDGKALPRGKTQIIFRGQMPGDPLGIAWTTDVQIAHRFAKGASARTPTPGEVLIGVVSRDDILGYLTGRGESEVVVDPANVREIETIAAYEYAK